jgi:hypothetical protein
MHASKVALSPASHPDRSRESHFTCASAGSSADDGQSDVFILKILDSECDMKESSTSSDQERYVNQ